MEKNYLKLHDKIIKECENEISLGKEKPSLLLHACCAPCSTHVLEYLLKYFGITVYYYNPNISPYDEYIKRAEQFDKIKISKDTIKYIIAPYNEEEFNRMIIGHENEAEGGLRCTQCFKLRLENSAKYAHDNSFDYYSTTLSISPHKNAVLLNEIGQDMAEKYNVKYLYADFKKKNGYANSIKLSKEYDIYRQDYCGCIYSFRN